MSVLTEVIETLSWREPSGFWPTERTKEIELELPSYGMQTFKVVDGYFGDYDSTGNIFVVFEVEGEYLRKDGYYRSHYGIEWDGSCYLVNPVERTITMWERA